MNDALRVYSWDDIASGAFLSPEELAAAGYEGTALTVGGFDGVHLGHQALFSAVMAQKRLLPGVVTFGTSPKARLNPEHFAGSVCTMEQRLNLFREAGFAFTVVIDFSGDFGRMEGVVFLQHLRDNLSMRYLAEGTDFRCGYKGSVNIDFLRSFARETGVRLDVVEPVIAEGVRVSSSEIRCALLEGDLVRCSRLLGRNFSLGGSCFDWSQEGASLLGTRRRGPCGCMQVLPPDGTYQAVLYWKDGKSFQRGQVVIQGEILRFTSPVGEADDGIKLPVAWIEFLVSS